MDTENAMEKDKSRYAVPVKKVTFKRQKLAEEEQNGSHLLADNGTGARSMRSQSNDSLSWTPLSKDTTLRVKRKGKPRGRNDSSSSSRHNATDLSVASMLPGHEGLIGTSTPLAIGPLAGSFRANSSTPKTDNASFISSTSFGQDDELLAAVDLSNIVSQSCEGSEGKEPAKAEDKVINGLSDVKEGSDFPSASLVLGIERLDDNEVAMAQKKLDCVVGKGAHAKSTACSAEEDQFYGLPVKVKELLSQHRGIDKLYDWQHNCLSLEALQAGRNLIYSLPTSGGKTLVAEILILKELLVKGKDALLILPFVSIVQEKVKALTEFAVGLDFLVEEYASSKGQIPPRKRRKKHSLYIATIEKANALVNSLIEESRLDTIGLVVVDELHMLGEGGGRGVTLEMCLSKLLFVAKSTQVVGMSATLSNTADLQAFLRADVYSSNFRPVELREYVKVGTAIYDVTDSSKTEEGGHVTRHIRHSAGKNRALCQQDPDHVVKLATEVIPQHSCLVFCPTKKHCENLALMLIKFIPRELTELKSSERQELLRALHDQTNGVCPTLKKTVPFGLAYHHSGLTTDERKLIEDAYSQGVLCLLTCTSTLAAGVNLPAKRVIIRQPFVGRELLSRSQYKQMAGRAGRAGIDSSGESILILKETDKRRVGHLFTGQCESCRSSLLYDDGKGLRALILTLVGLKLCSSTTEITQFFQTTLLAVQTNGQVNSTPKAGSGPVSLQSLLDAAVESLVELGLVRGKRKGKSEDGAVRIEITPLGQASFKGCIDVDATPLIYKELYRAQEDLVLVTELHLLYVVTPLDTGAQIEPDWMTYLRQVTSLSPAEQHAADVIGVTEAYLCKRVSGQRKKDDANAAAAKRFYRTLMLFKLMNENTLWDVADSFQVPRGLLQSLVSSACTFASCLTHFTGELSEFWGMKLLLDSLVKKLTFMSKLELVPLLEVPGVKQARARQLFRAGYQTLSDLARAAPETLVKTIEHLPRRQATQIVAAAQMLLSEKADALREEADELTAQTNAPNTSGALPGGGERMDAI